MAEPTEIIDQIMYNLSKNLPLTGKNVLITSGPTYEQIDPVRFIGNNSSGKMGYAIAESAINRNHEVILVSGPVALEPPQNCRIIKVETAAQMYDEVSSNSNNCDAVIMVAAVATNIA